MTGSEERMCAKTGKGGETGREFKRRGLHWMGLKFRLSLRVETVRWHMISDELQSINTGSGQAALSLTLACALHPYMWHKGATQVCEGMGLGISTFIL